MWSNIRIGIIGQGSQYNRISKILKTKGIKFITYKPPRDKNYYDKKKFEELIKCNTIFILSPNDTHLKYIRLLKDNRFIFCEKPPVNKFNDLKNLKKIKSKKIYFNYNFRFSKISEILGNANKFNLKLFQDMVLDLKRIMQEVGDLIENCAKRVFLKLYLHTGLIL